MTAPLKRPDFELGAILQPGDRGCVKQVTEEQIIRVFEGARGRSVGQRSVPEARYNMLVTQTNESVRSIIDGGGKSVKLSIESNPVYQIVLIAAEMTFWRTVKVLTAEISD